jgi:hypothetical protein
MLRFALILAVLIASATCIGSDDPKYTKTLAEILRFEDEGAFDNEKLTVPEQMAAVKKRFYGYRDDLCNTPEDMKATKDGMLRAIDRIIERLKENLRDAEEHRDRLINPAVPT